MTTLQIQHGIDWAQSQEISDIAERFSGTCRGSDIWEFKNARAVEAIAAFKAAGYVPTLINAITQDN